MAVHINEVIIRAIITGDDKNEKKKSEAPPEKGVATDDPAFEITELVDEILKSKRER